MVCPNLDLIAKPLSIKLKKELMTKSIGQKMRHELRSDKNYITCKKESKLVQKQNSGAKGILKLLKKGKKLTTE